MRGPVAVVDRYYVNYYPRDSLMSQVLVTHSFSLVTPLLITGFLFTIFNIVFLFSFGVYFKFCALLNVYYVSGEGRGLCASLNL
jgi:hypothetical protein